MIEFDEFVHALSIFHPHASREEKTDCKCRRESLFGFYRFVFDHMYAFL